jgi:uncharacterized protein (TIGR02466 family)
MPTEHWFSTPIFAYDLTGSDLETVQSEIASNLEQIRKVASDTSTQWGDSVVTTFNGTNDIEAYNLIALNNFLFGAVQEYMNNIRYIGAPVELVESWFNFYKKDGFQYDHTHPNYRISGTYYYASNGEDGSIRFQNPNQHVHAHLFPADGVSTESISYTPKVGRLLLFPSWLVHRVNMNNTDHERISIAMNFK